MTPRDLFAPADYGRVAVCAGGNSAEREISLQSGAAAWRALRAIQIDAELVELDDKFLVRALAGEFERVFIAVHGRGGEDGSLQGFFDLINLPYTGSGATASLLGMNKHLSKLVWQAAGLPTPAWKMVSSLSELRQAGQILGLPLMVKPVGEGSSIGMSLVSADDQLSPAWQAASVQGQAVMAERCIVGDEYTAGLVQGRQLPLIRITTPHQFYDYAAKYQSDDTGYHCPAGLTPEVEKSLSELAQRAFDALGATGWGRVDLMLDGDGQPWLIEVNTVPGLTDHSLVPMAAAAYGWQFEQLVEVILQSSLDGVESAAGVEVKHGEH